MKGLELGIEQSRVGVVRAEALSRVVACSQTILLECAVDVALLPELLQWVGRPTHCLCHGGGGDGVSKEDAGICRDGPVGAMEKQESHGKKRDSNRRMLDTGLSSAEGHHKSTSAPAAAAADASAKSVCDLRTADVAREQGRCGSNRDATCTLTGKGRWPLSSWREWRQVLQNTLPNSTPSVRIHPQLSSTRHTADQHGEHLIAIRYSAQNTAADTHRRKSSPTQATMT